MKNSKFSGLLRTDALVSKDEASAPTAEPSSAASATAKPQPKSRRNQSIEQQVYSVLTQPSETVDVSPSDSYWPRPDVVPNSRARERSLSPPPRRVIPFRAAAKTVQLLNQMRDGAR